jgi:hypothetical protein
MFMTKRKKLIITTASVLGVALAAGLIFLVLLRGDTANTHDVEICVERDRSTATGDVPGKCIKHKTAKIVNGSENIGYTRVGRSADCSQYGGEPLFEYVGGGSGYAFHGCEVK